MKTKIQPVSKTESIDYSNAIIQNIWHCKKEYFLDNKRNRIQDLIKSSIGESVICILTEEFTDKLLLETLHYLTQSNPNDLRVYILVNSYSNELNSLSNHCLIRYEGLQIKGTFVLLKDLSGKTPKGIFFTGRLTEQSLAVSDHLIFDIDEQDISKLYTHFCYLFWHSAKKEVIQNNHQEINSRPLDVFHNPFEYDNRDYVYATLFNFSSQIPRGDLMNKHILYLNKETQIPILIQPESEKKLGDNILQSLLPKEEFQVQKPTLEDDGVSCSITYSWNNIPYYLPKNATEHTLYKEWKNKQDEIIKKLNAIQEKIEEAENKEKSISKKLARFFLGKKTIFSNLNEEIDNLQNEDYPKLTEIKLKEKINQINEIFKKVQGHIVEIETEDRKAKIEEEIDEIKQKISEKRKELETKNQELQEKEKERNDKIENFCKAYGFNKEELDKVKKDLSSKVNIKLKQEYERKLSEFQSKIQEVENIENSNDLDEQQRKQKIEVFCKKNNIRDDLPIKKVQWENIIRDTNRKIEELEQIENSELNDKKKNQKLQEFSKKYGIKKNNNVNQTKESLNNIINTNYDKIKELEQIENSTDIDEEQRKQKLQEFCKKNNIIRTDLPTTKTEWQNQKNEYENKLNEFQIAEERLEQLKRLEDDTFIQKIRDEIRKIEQQLKNYEGQVMSKEKEKNKETPQNQSTTSYLNELIDTPKKQNTSGNFVSLPDLPQLPQTGKLYQHSGQTYLSIEFWEEYEQGKKEAERLKAKLCTIL